MEIKLIIAPSDSMVDLVDKLVDAFSGKSVPLSQISRNEEEFKPSVEDAIRAVEEQVQTTLATKKRRTRAEIEAERLANEAERMANEAERPANELADAEKEIIRRQETPEGETEEPSAEETAAKDVSNEKVPSVETLRLMTRNRGSLIADVPAELAKFGYSSVTALARDEEAAKKYYAYLISVKPYNGEDNV